MQVAGILASLLSVARTCSDDFIIHSFNSDERHIEPGVWYSLKALAFFLPHVIFRTTSTAFVAAFLKWYALIPITGYLIVNMVITLVLKKKYDGNADVAFLDYAVSLFTPAASGSTTKHDRSQLKATMLSSTTFLLPCLIFIQILPLLPPEVVSCSLGLHHLNHSDNIPSCSPCFNLTTTNNTLTGDHYSNCYESICRHPVCDGHLPRGLLLLLLASYHPRCLVPLSR